MSTGLTYVSVVDFTGGEPDGVTNSTVFASYDEAIEYVKWMANLTYAINSGPKDVYFCVWNAAGNPNGYTVANSLTPEFIPYT